MNPLESQLVYPFAEAIPEKGTVLEVAPGVNWTRMALPFALDHINVWLLKDDPEMLHGDGSGWTIVDCGVNNDATHDAWQGIFNDSLDTLPVKRVLATHCHPDHVGSAHWLCERWQAPLWMSAAEFGFARMMSAALPGADGTSALPHFMRHGVQDSALITQLRERRNYYPSLVPELPSSYHRIQDGEAIRIGRHDWRVITGFGHSPEHVSLYCAALNVLISGDMVLPRISTNVSVFAIEPEANPLQLYLDSLKKYGSLPHDTLVLPSHGKPFRGLHTRITQLQDHHAVRLAEVRAACRTPQSAADIVPIMFKRALDAHQLSFALGEALAHLHYLWREGSLHRKFDDKGVCRFRIT
ncbi:MBL fold metallo-hydrolase [Oxalobacteraceae bacterium R-40]|uniref:MBL fold metallo-hydrolase n=1 Tax=Keguizhuia sedimenti TaxID=3064264 RepID=A0ABU1BUL1_9BURK|nr:MBL fold metallo-hydrolase [Oxalobacteraceae bacterium R-40]